MSEFGKIISRIRKFRSDDTGGFSVQFAIILLPFLMIMGGTFDFAQQVSSKKKLQLVADTAALAAVNGNFTEAERQTTFSSFVDETIDPSWNLKNVSYTTTVTKEGPSIKVLGNVSAEIETISLHYVKLDRVVLVESEATYGVQDVELVLAIDISSSMNGARITEAKASAKKFVGDLLTKPELNGRVNISIVPFGGTVKVPQSMSTMVAKQSDLEDWDVKKHWMGNSWNGCFELSPSDFTSEINPGKRYDTMPDFYSWHKANPWCPRIGSEFLPLTDDESLLKEKIQQLTLSDGTGTDHGLAWARVNLSEDWKGKLPGGKSNLPRAAGPETQKIIVLMTDGGVTGQHYVRSSDMKGTLPYNSKKRSRVKGTDAWASFSGLCNNIKQSGGTQIITISYLISNTSHKDRLKACASSVEKYYDSSSGELEGIFDDVVASITPIRLSQ